MNCGGSRMRVALNQTRGRRRWPLLLCLSATIVAACSSSASAPGPPTLVSSTLARPTPAEGPVASFRLMLDALNARDAAGVSARLSTEARKELSNEQVQDLVARLLANDPDFRITIATAGEPAVNGTDAQFNLTLAVNYQGKTFPLSDVAYMQLEDGQWRLADHFLQTALAAAGLAAPPGPPRVIGADGCVQGDVLAGVYLPSRLQVLEPCVTIEAIVREVEPREVGENDGDFSFNVELAPADERLLNDGNRQNFHGWLHLEIVPQDRASLPTPAEGQRIRATGPWVLDRVHGHNEIHPVWSLTILP